MPLARRGISFPRLETAPLFQSNSTIENSFYFPEQQSHLGDGIFRVGRDGQVMPKDHELVPRPGERTVKSQVA